MSKPEQEPNLSIPSILNEIWNNWRVSGGAGTCEGCDANWQNRTDIEGIEGERDGVKGIGPYYGVGSLDPDVIILGREPGPIKDQEDREDTNFTSISFEERYRSDLTTAADPGTRNLKSIRPMLEKIKSSSYDGYFSQLRKCHQYPYGSDVDEESIRDRCCGLSPNYDGYLRNELESLDPRLVIPLAKATSKKLFELYNTPVPWNNNSTNFSEFSVSGSHNSGFNPINHENLPYAVAPTAHPSRGWSHVSNTLKNRDINSKKEHYRALGEAIISYLND